MDTGLPSTPPATVNPCIPPTERLDSIDLIRGVAVCGILVMNIVSFGMPAAAYLNPEAYLGEQPLSHWIYGFTHVLADQKFMGLFSLLFGSSAMLLIAKLRERGHGVKRYYYSRTLWLLLFGLLHGILLWEGDILLYYAFCGLFLYPFWRLNPGSQFTIGLAIFLSALAIDNIGQDFVDSLSPFALESLEPTWSPGALDISFEQAVRLSSFAEQLSYRAILPGSHSDSAMSSVSDFYVAQGLARAFGMMLIGMALYSWGVVSARQSPSFYRKLATVGVGLGLPLALFGLYQNYLQDWDIRYGLFHGLRYNHLATPLLVFAYLGLILRLHQSRWLPGLQRGLCAIGRMAFSNYIGQSVICTWIFYGHGLGLFGALGRGELMLIVVAIWVLQFYLSLAWLSRFRYGPLEWCWRALTYFRLPPMRIRS